MPDGGVFCSAALVELEDLPGDAVAADNDGIALGEVQVGDAAQAQADSAVHAGAGVLLEVLPELGLFLPGLGTGYLEGRVDAAALVREVLQRQRQTPARG